EAGHLAGVVCLRRPQQVADEVVARDPPPRVVAPALWITYLDVEGGELGPGLRLRGRPHPRHLLLEVGAERAHQGDGHDPDAVAGRGREVLADIGAADEVAQGAV